QKCLVVFQFSQSRDDAVEVGPGAGGPAGSAVDHQSVGVFGDLGIEVVHQHAQGGFLNPTLTRSFGSARGADVARSGRHEMSPAVRVHRIVIILPQTQVR